MHGFTFQISISKQYMCARIYRHFINNDKNQIITGQAAITQLKESISLMHSFDGLSWFGFNFGPFVLFLRFMVSNLLDFKYNFALDTTKEASIVECASGTIQLAPVILC